MTLRRKLALRYGCIVALCGALLGGLAYHELIAEPKQRAAAGIPKPPETFWSEYFEVFIYAAIPLVLGGGWWFMRKTLTPIDRLVREMEEVSVANLHRPLAQETRGDELDRLTAAFNSLVSRLNLSFQQMRQFTLHASHELKTPLTVMWLQLETLLQEGDPLLPAQRESIECQLNEVQRLGRIVDALTLLTKADLGQVKLERKPVALAEVVKEAFEDAQILAEREGIRVSLLECAEIQLIGDRDRLRQLLLNLVDNAIKYNQPNGSVTLALSLAEGCARLDVTNTGEGIPSALQPRLFQRFVRGEEARSKAIEGCGLGLSICQWIVQAHGGTIQISSAEKGLTRVTVCWPLPPSPAARGAALADAPANGETSPR